MTLEDFAAHQQAVLRRIAELLQADLRVAGVWLSGAHGRDEDDEWSDFDVQIAVEDEHYRDFLADRPLLYASVGEILLVQQEMKSDYVTVGDGMYQLVYFDVGIMVDWNIGPASLALKPIGHRVLFERRPFPVIEAPRLTAEERVTDLQRWTTFFWAMAPIALKYAARGSSRQGASQTDLLARSLICVQRLLSDDAPIRPWQTAFNRRTEDEIDASLPRKGSIITPLALVDVIEAQCVLMAGFNSVLTELGVDVHPKLQAEMPRLLTLSRNVAAADAFPPRRYR